MKQKLLVQLITKYLGMSRIFLGLYANKLAAKVTEESQIQAVIDELENLPISIPELAAEFQKEGDRRVTEAQKKAAEKKPGEEGKTGEEKTEQKPNDTPDWAKALIEEVKTLKAEKAQSGIKAKAADKLKDIPASYYEKRTMPERKKIVFLHFLCGRFIYHLAVKSFQIIFFIGIVTYKANKYSVR